MRNNVRLKPESCSATHAQYRKTCLKEVLALKEPAVRHAVRPPEEEGGGGGPVVGCCGAMDQEQGQTETAETEGLPHLHLLVPELGGAYLLHRG